MVLDKRNQEVYGDSELTIEEITQRGQRIYRNINGKQVALLPANVQPPLKCYILIEKMKRYNVTMVDLVYGQIDLPRLETDPEYQKEILGMLTRDQVELAVRARTGALVTGDNAVDQELMAGVSEGMSNMDRTLVYSGSALYERKELPKGKKTPDTDKQIVTEPRAFFKELARYVREDMLKSKKAREEVAQASEDAKRTILERYEIVYIPTGAVIVGETVCNKFTYGSRLTEQDANEAGTTSQGIVTDCFCVSGIDITQLNTNGAYMTQLSNALLKGGKKSILGLLHIQRTEKGSYFSYTGDYRSTQGAFHRNGDVSDTLLDINNRVYQKGNSKEARE